MPDKIWAGVYGENSYDEYGEWDTDPNATCATPYIRADLVDDLRKATEAIIRMDDRKSYEFDMAKAALARIDALKEK